MTETRQPLIASLLAAAREDFEAQRLTTPIEQSAYQKYLRILSIDETNQAAIEGINTIVEQYLSWAIDKATQDNHARALQYLAKARSIDATHPNIQPVSLLIDQARTRATTVYRLPADAVAQRRGSEIDFRGISARILEQGALISIRAANDATGRWLYQELNRHAGVRIEARFETGHPPSISLIQQE